MSSLTEPSTPPAPATIAGTGPGATLAVISAATLLVLMNYCAPMTTLPQTVAGLGSGVTGQTWILNGIALGLSAFLLSAGSLADDYGRKRMFVIGAGLLAASSIAAAIATTTLVFVLARVVQGAASAALLATSLGIIGQTFPAGPARVRATTLWGALLGAGIALGPLLAGALADFASWRLVYAVFAGIAVVVTGLAVLVLTESRAAEPQPVDLVGIGTLGLGLTALLAALTEGRLGWDQPHVIGLFVVAALLLAGFVVAERRGRAPMLDLGLFRQHLFLVSTGGAFVTGLSIIGLMSYLPTVLQQVLGQGPLASAAIFSIWSGTAFVVALQSRRLTFSPQLQLAAGFVLAAIGNLMLLGIASSWSLGRAAVSLLVAGAGSGLVNAALPRLAIASVPADRSSMGSGANNTARYIGSSTGVAIAVAVVAAASGPGNDLPHGLDVELFVAAALALVGAILAVAVRANGLRRRPGLQLR